MTVDLDQFVDRFQCLIVHFGVHRRRSDRCGDFVAYDVAEDPGCRRIDSVDLNPTHVDCLLVRAESNETTSMKLMTTLCVEVVPPKTFPVEHRCHLQV